MKTVILGKRSNLTSCLKKTLRNPIVLGKNEIIEANIKKLPNKFNLIINTFHPSNQLSSINNFETFFQNNFIYISKFLDSITHARINKIIYTSSSSVYGDIKDYKNIRNLNALSKLLVENYLLNINSLRKKLIISRIFNMYDDNENFSIISKILNKLKKKKNNLTIFNKGEGIRDFINISDVAKIYSRLIKSNILGIVDIGTGKGIKIIDLINSLKIKKFSNYNNSNELKISIANINKIKKILNELNIQQVENFFKKKGYNINKINRFTIPSKKNYFQEQNSLAIYGCGYSGKKIYDQIISKNPKTSIFYIDDNKKKIGTFYKKAPIVSLSYFKNIFNYLNVTNIVIAIPSLNHIQRKKIYFELKTLSANILILPPKNEIINDKIVESDIRKIEFSDFSNREPSKINSSLIRYLNKKNILITGGAGSIGGELANQICKTNINKIIIFDNNETELFRIADKIDNRKIIPVLGDINDKIFLKNIIKKNNISHVFHAAAFKHVNLLENNILYAIKNNILGTLSVLESLNDNVRSFVLISTDKAANPTNILGISKKISEIIAFYYQKKILTKMKLSVVRFGNVFGSRGSAIEIFLNQISNKIPITITNKNAERFFMSIKEACNLVLQCESLKSKKNGIFILKMGKPIKITKVVDELLKHYNLKNYPIKFIGLKKGEKLKEILTNSKKIFKTKHKDIILVNEKNYKENEIRDLIKFVKSNIYKSQDDNLIRKLKSFIRN